MASPGRQQPHSRAQRTNIVKDGPGPTKASYGGITSEPPSRARSAYEPRRLSEQLFVEPCCSRRTAATCNCRGLGRVTRLGAASTLGSSAPLSSRRISLALMTVTWAIGSYTNVSFRSSAADGSRSHHCTVIACSPTASPPEIGILVFSRALARALTHTCTCLYAKRTARDAGIARVS